MALPISIDSVPEIISDLQKGEVGRERSQMRRKPQMLVVDEIVELSGAEQ
jgi:hypothetical protein